MLSIVIPCLNEKDFIARCLDSIVANDYPKERMEVLVVDGMSTDGTRAIVEEYHRRHPFIRLLDNPQKVTPAALNVGILAAKGDVVMRMDAHASYAPNYISLCLRALEEHPAENVGGLWTIVPREDTLTARAVVAGLSHRFGIGNAEYRLKGSGEPRWVDTVPYFCVRKETFNRLGLFNENLHRGQDMEFNLRMQKAGGRTLLVPAIESTYYARSDLGSFTRHNWRNGEWAILPFVWSNVVPVSLRHLVPLAFVTGLFGSLLLSFFWHSAVWLFATIAGSYAFAVTLASLDVASHKKDIRYFFLMPFIFADLHIAYGLGSLYGGVKSLLLLIKMIFSRDENNVSHTAR
ncbi:MAG TPA: glycosyltransferase family 2 protein [bacterium]|nr:glycosyltransferase family 2 protein [bacterium]